MSASNNTVRQEIVGYVLQEPRRLETAAEIFHAFDAIRSEIIKGFALRLEQALVQALPVSEGWEIDAHWLKDKPLNQYTGLAIRRDSWDKGLAVTLEAQRRGAREWIIGAAGENAQCRENIKKHLDDKFGAGGQSQAWPWYRYLRQEWRAWDTGAALISLHQDGQGGIGEYLCSELVNMSLLVDTLFSPATPQKAP